ncbi:MAG: hypothetical protein R2716_00780 [Microthrixaceae bacterium]
MTAASGRAGSGSPSQFRHGTPRHRRRRRRGARGAWPVTAARRGDRRLEGRFEASGAVEIVDTEGRIVTEGHRVGGAPRGDRSAGRRSDESGVEELVHRDDMVVLA